MIATIELANTSIVLHNYNFFCGENNYFSNF